MTVTRIEVNMPCNYVPRPYQNNIWEYFESGGNRAVCVWHRRAGKDLTAINILGTAAIQRVGLYWHMLPTFEQGRRVAWDGHTAMGDRFLDAFPPELISRIDNVRMSVHLKNGSIYQIVGADDPSRLVGANPVGLILSEWSLMNPSVWDYLSPILVENKGWAIFVYTPRGRNHGLDLYEMAKNNPKWYCEKLGVTDTGAITEEEIQKEREEGRAEEIIQQEYYCSFDASLVGAYYAKQMADARRDKRIREHVPVDPFTPVNTAWDLGMADETAIWFFQTYGGEIRLIDCYSNTGEGLAHYAKVLKEKGYLYGNHYAPHDIQVRELGTGKSRLETARKFGIKFKIIPRLSVEDGIEAARNILPICYFDETKCKQGIRALQEYTKEWDDKKKIFKNQPLHNWTSHYGDAFRGLAVIAKNTGLKPTSRVVSNRTVTDYNIFTS